MARCFHKLCLRFRSVFRKSDVEGELSEELRFHLEHLIEEKVSQGMTAEEARYAALRELGGVDQIKEECRDMRRVNYIENFAQDVRYGLRTLVKNPGFTAVAVVTVSLGVALNTTIFSLVSAALLRRPPVTDPERVVMVMSTNSQVGWTGGLNPVSAPNFVDWRNRNHVFEGVAAADAYGSTSLTGQGEPERVSSMRVSADYFSILAVAPALGRVFVIGEDQAGHNRVVILSYELWQQRFGADPNLIGKSVGLNGESYTVVGVMPASFRLPSFQAKLWTPLVLGAEDLEPKARGHRFLYLFARLRPGASVELAKTQITTFVHRSQQDYPDAEKGWGATVLTLQEYMIRDMNSRPPLVMLMCAVGFVLLIACANIAGLLVARATARGKEMAIRTALGARRLRVVRQLLTESLLIALLGGLLGLLFSVLGVGLLRASLSFNDAVRSFQFGLDGNVLAFTLIVSMLAAILFGLAPSLQASRVNVYTTLKNDTRAGSGGRAGSRLRSVLVAGEIALALVLVTGTGLMMKGVADGMRRSLGFDPQHLLVVDVSLGGSQYQAAPKQAAFFRDAMERLRGLPGVQSVGGATSLAATGAGRVQFRLEGQLVEPNGERRRARHYIVSPDYFQTMGIPLLSGRGFAVTDRADAPGVVLVNQTFARRFFQQQEAVGKRISVENDATGAPEWREIVGVVGNVLDWPLQSYDEPQIYEPYLQRPSAMMTLAIRAGSDPASLAPMVRRAIWAVDKDQPIGNVASMTQLLSDETAGERLMGKLFGVFAGLALTLAAVGIYGTAAYGVGRRTHEIAIRVALGARKIEILQMVLGGGVKLILTGTVVGLALALPLPKLFESALIDFHVHAAWLFVATPALLGAVAMLACYVPARRATKVDPMAALRYE